jgi:mannosyltransferase OCH1-like enzyme
MGKASGFEVIEVNMSNIKQYLAEEVLLRIETTIAHAQLKTYPQSKGDLYRLALLAEYGGIYMDASYIAL